MKTPPYMKVIFHGVRGSRPVHHKDFLNIGGNSTCIEFRCSEDFGLFLDAGTGLANFLYKKTHPRRKRYHFLITHTHWDHIITAATLPILQDPDMDITFYASTGSNGRFEDLLKKLWQRGFSPIAEGTIRAKLSFVEVSPGEPIVIESSVRVEAFQLNHQAVTLGYKVSYAESSVVAITDTAPMNGTNYLGDGMRESVLIEGSKTFEANYEKNLLSFVKGVDTLVFDTHFNEENLKPDWGHSTPNIALDLCKKAGVKTLLMFHHAPEDDESKTDEKLKTFQKIGKIYSIEVKNACEGDEWPLKSA